MDKNKASTSDLAKVVFDKLNKNVLGIQPPPIDVLNELFGVLFYTSLKTEEARSIKATITFIDPNNPSPVLSNRKLEYGWRHVKFDEQVPLTVKNLVKLSKAADPWSS